MKKIPRYHISWDEIADDCARDARGSKTAKFYLNRDEILKKLMRLVWLNELVNDKEFCVDLYYQTQFGRLERLNREFLYRTLHSQFWMPPDVQAGPEVPPARDSRLWQLISEVDYHKIPEGIRQTFCETITVEDGQLRRWTEKHGEPWLARRWFGDKEEKTAGATLAEAKCRTMLKARVQQAQKSREKLWRIDMWRQAQDEVGRRLSERAFRRAWTDCVPNSIRATGRRPSAHQSPYPS